MSLTKATNSMIVGAPINVFDYLPAAQIAYIQAGNTTAQDASVVTAGIQAAIDYAIYNNQGVGGISHGKVLIPAGRYKTNDTIQLGYGNSFHSVVFEGEGQRYRGEVKFAGTAIFPTFNDRPVIAVSGGRRTVIRGMSLCGLNYDWIANNLLGAYTTPLIDDLVAANWVDPSFPASATSRYAPYAGIAVDPYAGAAPTPAYPNVTFPSWSGITTQYNKAYSSNTLIEEVYIGGFVVGVVNQPSDADGNGDYTKLVGCNVECNQYSVSIGNTQSRIFRLQNCVLASAYTHIITGLNGKRLGNTQILCDSTEMNSCIYWMSVKNTSYGQAPQFVNCYGESIYSLGFGGISGAGVGKSAISFLSCQFSFDWWHRGVANFVFSGSGNPISFRDCRFDAATDAANSAVNNFHFDIPASAAVIDNCTVIAGFNATKYYQKFPLNATGGMTFAGAGAQLANFNLQTQSSFNLNTGAYNGEVYLSNTTTFSSRATCLSVYSQKILSTAAYENDPGISFTSGRLAIDKTSCATITQTGKLVTVDTTGAVIGAWQFIQSGGEVGDVIVDSVTSTAFFVKSRTGLSIILEAQNNYNAAGNLLVSITKTGTFYAINCRRYTPYYVLDGNYTSASATITNVQRPDGFATWFDNASNGLQINDYLWVGSGASFYPTVPSSAKITGLDTAAKTITLNSTLTYTQARVRQTIFIRAAPANDT